MVASSFELYLDRLDVARLVDDGTISRADLVGVIQRLDSAVAEIDGHGFVPTPFGPQPGLCEAIGLSNGTQLWVKNETGNVSGSHKARHLFGVAIRESIVPSGDGVWAIASCGNAALGASVVAAAVDHGLDVFVPTWANDAVVSQMEGLGARVVRTDRNPGVVGDPAHHAMLAAVAAGATAFSCQGTETPAAIDGGRTMAYEMVDTLAAHDIAVAPRLDRLFVQVGGGALGTAVVTGLARTELDILPVVHAVQPVGNHPLVRAWDTLVSELAGEAIEPTVSGRLRVAKELGAFDDPAIRDALVRLSADPSVYMRPWDDEPTSYASGILDDVTYDWVQLIEAMLRTGGCPIVASELTLQEAHRVAHQHTDIPVCPTGAAGLSGLITLRESEPGAIADGERVAVLFTGRMRPGDPDPLAD
ncbi:MAG: PLP-dependent lyase/thiolase [Acidimicrobiaceae bacterium]|jgi:threonine synthase|nr:PLP-dependent lyase/thiolase [Acidimicrobiaceae bacterium]MBT5581906.1 PLP-dependent lyase/thiolase [Acidimicrobiaceae bacterium]